jgi:hypothetical protein
MKLKIFGNELDTAKMTLKEVESLRDELGEVVSHLDWEIKNRKLKERQHASDVDFKTSSDR